MANPSGPHNHDSSNQAPSSFNGANINPNNGITGHENTSLKHNPGISIEWTPEEQAILEDGLNKYMGESNIIRYAKVAMLLRNKTVRDVALRVRWMTVSKKENSKRRKEDNISKKGKDKKERVNDSAANAHHYGGHSGISPYGTSMIPIDYSDGFSFDAIGGLRGELLEENALAFSKVKANISTLEVLGKSQPIYDSHPLIEENIALLGKVRDNINRIMINMNEMPAIMKQMPPLPVKMNENLANAACLPPNAPPPNRRLH